MTAEIPAGSFAFLLGPSGSGKSSLLYLMGGLDDASGGEIAVDGTPLSQFSDADRDAFRRERVGFIFQAFNLLGNLDAVDNVLVPFLPKGVPAGLRERAVALLKQVGLGDRLDHRPNQLSGGEQQRVAIARALLKNPQIVLADEPTGELDSATGAEIFAELRRLHAAGGDDGGGGDARPLAGDRQRSGLQHPRRANRGSVAAGRPRLPPFDPQSLLKRSVSVCRTSRGGRRGRPPLRPVAPQVAHQIPHLVGRERREQPLGHHRLLALAAFQHRGGGHRHVAVGGGEGRLPRRSRCGLRPVTTRPSSVSRVVGR